MAKITRKFLNVFGLSGASTYFGKFGSRAAGSAVKTKDIETIQELTAYANGLQDAINSANKAPFLEDMNSLFYLLSYHMAYSLQEGIPEWNADTTYYIGSIVKKTGTAELYFSLTDTNLNNSLPDKTNNTDWEYMAGTFSKESDTLTLSDTFNTSSLSYVARTGASLTVTIRSTKVLIDISSTWAGIATSGGVCGGYGRINIDSGSQYIYMGGFVSSGLTGVGPISINKIIEGLTPGEHTFAFEVATDLNCTLYNRCTGISPVSEVCHMSVLEL